MTTKRLTGVIVLVAAIAALVASLAWAVTQSNDDRDWGMMRLGPGMMGYASSTGGEPVRSLDGARRRAEQFADRLDLRVGEVMQFANGYYAELTEDDDRGATEVLINPRTGAVWIEYGPAMMWNSRYGLMAGSRFNGSGGMMGGSGMMGGGGGMMDGMMGGGDFADPTWPVVPDADAKATISPRQAEQIAQRWLDRARSALRVGEAEEFPGYYTLHTLRNGRVAGMLSVNAFTGAVWYHWWHGRFVTMTA